MKKSRWQRFWVRFKGEAAFARRMEKLEERVNAEIEGIINGKDDKAIDAILERIKDRRSSLHIQPEFTHLVVTISGQILAFGSAGLGLMIAFSNKIPAFTDYWKEIVSLLGLFYIDLVLIALVVLLWFLIQSRIRYPFLYLKHLGNTVPYYYYETLSRRRSWKPLQLPADTMISNIYYLKDLRKYVKYAVSENKKQQLKVELQQFYLLINYQGYLDQFEMQLEHIFLYGLFGSLASVLTLYIFL